MSIITKPEILTMDKRYRVQLINSLTGYKSANLIGTKNTKDQTNLAIFSSLTHMGSDPALLSLNFRPDKTPRQTFENIMETKYFTVNHVDRSFYKKAHLTSAKYPKGVSEFHQLDFTEEWVNYDSTEHKDNTSNESKNTSTFFAPFVKDAKVKIGMKMVEHHFIKANNTELIVASVEFIICDPKNIEVDGSLNYESLGTVALSGLDTYYTTQKLEKLPYAHAPKELK